MNLRDLKPNSYKVISNPTNINQLQQGSYSTSGFPTQEPEHVKQSFLNRIANFGLGAVKGAVNTVVNSTDLVHRGLDKIADITVGGQGTATLKEITPENYYTPKGGAQKAGFITEQIAEFLIPASKVTQVAKTAQGAISGASKTSKLAGFATRSAVEGIGSAGVTAAQGGDIKTAAIAGIASPTVGKLFGAMGSGAKNVAKYISSTLSGVPEAAIEQAFKNPVAVRTAMERAATEGTELTAQKIHKQALNALDELKRVRSVVYKEGLKNITDDASTKAVPVSLTGLKNLSTKTLREFGLNANKRSIDIGSAALQKSHVKNLQELTNRIYSWKELTPTGLNNLRQVISGYRKEGIELSSADKQFNAIIGKLRDNLSDYVGSKVPKFKDLNRTYALQSEVIDNIRTQLKMGTADPNTALRKLVTVFNPKNSVYRPLVKELGDQSSVDLMSDIAGLTMAQWSPQGIGKYLTGVLEGGFGVATAVNPGMAVPLAATAAASSPKIVGKVVTKAGKLAPAAKKATEKVGQVTKAAIIQAKNRSKQKQKR